MHLLKVYSKTGKLYISINSLLSAFKEGKSHIYETYVDMYKPSTNFRIILYTRKSDKLTKLSYINLLLFVDDANDFSAILRIQ